MKAILALALFTSVAYGRPHTLIKCSPLAQGGISADFIFDHFDDKHSKVTVFTHKKLLFAMNGDTSLNPCLEVDMSAGSDSAETFRDIIAVFAVHELNHCRGPFNSVRLGASGNFSSDILKGNLLVDQGNRHTEEKVKCLIKDIK